MTETAYQHAVEDWEEARAEREVERRRHEEAERRLTDRLAEAERVMRIAESAGTSVAGAYVTARDLISIEWRRARDGRYERTNEVMSCFYDAIHDLRLGARSLQRRYLGVKAYARWGSQRSDHEYGMAPSHGTIWFRIGLRHPGDALDEEQRIDCIRWLTAVQNDPDGMLG
jgi:hypothetical protein